MPAPDRAKPRDPGLAAALSLLLPGLGQHYAGRTGRGLAWLAGGLLTLAGTVSWVLSETSASPWQGLAWYGALLFFQWGSWIDALAITRRSRPRFRRLKRPALAAALSVFFPGLGQAYLLFRSRILRLLFAPLFALPGLLVICGEVLESSAVPGWPKWLADWPLSLAIPAWGLLSTGSIAHAWCFSFRANGHQPRLPRIPFAIGLIALLAWGNGLVPWEALFKMNVKTFQIPSSSMEPTLQIKDRLWARRLPEYRAGDIVVFVPPHDPAVDYIKRVIALPGETVSVRGRTVRVNGKTVREPWAVWRQGGIKDFGPFRVPAGHLFVMGDNRDNSYDSRFFGPVKLESVFGRAYKLYWPFSRAVPLPRPAR